MEEAFLPRPLQRLFSYFRSFTISFETLKGREVRILRGLWCLIHLPLCVNVDQWNNNKKGVGRPVLPPWVRWQLGRPMGQKVSSAKQKNKNHFLLLPPQSTPHFLFFYLMFVDQKWLGGICSLMDFVTKQQIVGSCLKATSSLWLLGLSYRCTQLHRGTGSTTRLWGLKIHCTKL